MSGFVNEEDWHQFFMELEALFNKWKPKMAGSENLTDDILDGFDPDSSRVIDGVLIIVAETDNNGWTSVFRSYSPSTNFHAVMGLALDLLDWSRDIGD